MSNINWRIILNHTILLIGVIFMSLPVWVAFSTSTHSAETILREGLQFWPGTNFIGTYREVLFEQGGVMKSVLGITMLKNSMILGIGFAIGKVIVSMLAAYAIVYFG
jgi:sn-glycerol 3-phosphate transport system permease protein